MPSYTDIFNNPPKPRRRYMNPGTFGYWELSNSGRTVTRRWGPDLIGVIAVYKNRQKKHAWCIKNVETKMYIEGEAGSLEWAKHKTARIVIRTKGLTVAE